MAHREQRSNREKKKPKQDKNKKVAQPSGFSAQMNQAKAPQGAPQPAVKK
jgi:hypothetical protein